jgi:hypothetical protein
MCCCLCASRIPIVSIFDKEPQSFVEVDMNDDRCLVANVAQHQLQRDIVPTKRLEALQHCWIAVSAKRSRISTGCGITQAINTTYAMAASRAELSCTKFSAFN